MKVKTIIERGFKRKSPHSQGKSLKVKTAINSGMRCGNHNEKLVTQAQKCEPARRKERRPQGETKIKRRIIQSIGR